MNIMVKMLFGILRMIKIKFVIIWIDVWKLWFFVGGMVDFVLEGNCLNGVEFMYNE